MTRRNRIYATKGDAALHARIDVPVTVAFKKLVADRAREANKPLTEFARELLVAGVEAG